MFVILPCTAYGMYHITLDDILFYSPSVLLRYQVDIEHLQDYIFSK
jgi:hypothetical protein